MILESAGHDLRGAGAQAVHQNHQRHRRLDGLFLGQVDLRRRVAAPHTHQFLPLLEEQVAHGQRLVEDAAGILAQIEHDALGSLRRHQSPQRRIQIVRRVLVELLQRHVRNLAVQHDREGNRRHVDDGAGETKRDRLRHALAGKLHRYLGAGCPDQIFGDLRQLPPLSGRRVHLDDAIAFGDPRILGRRVREDVRDDDARARLADLHADATVAPAGASRELGEPLGRQKLGVGIVELVHQTGRRLFVQGRRVERVHEPVRHQGEHLVEDAWPVVADARLQREAARDERHQRQRRQCDGAKPGLAEGRHSTAARGGGRKRGADR